MAFDLDEDELKATRKMNKADRNEIEVGEYMRINNDFRLIALGIGKVIGINEDSIHVKMNFELPFSFKKENIANHSKQLIDLIEVGDIVKDKYNKYEVAFVKDDKIYCNDYNLDDSLITLREQDIKVILTKEQFEANCYKVGGEDEKI